MLLRNKKGDVSDGITYIIIIFFLAISLVTAAFIVTKFKDVVQNTPLNQSAASEDIIQGLDNITTTGVNRGFTMIFGVLIIGMMLSSFLVRVHPAWIFLYIIFLIIAVIVTVPMANIYNQFINVDALKSTADQQTQINWVMEHSIKILIGTVCLSLIILFAKIPERSEPI